MKHTASMKQLKKRGKCAQNSDWFRNECAKMDLHVHIFNRGLHLRVIGHGTVDYWPSTGKWWKHGCGKGSKSQSELIEALNNIAINKYADYCPELDPLDAQHMRSILH
jgi:hypothetical protein